MRRPVAQDVTATGRFPRIARAMVPVTILSLRSPDLAGTGEVVATYPTRRLPHSAPSVIRAPGWRSACVLRERARWSRTSRLAADTELRAVVQAKLELEWGPEQISGWLRSTSPDRLAWHVCHEPCTERSITAARAV